MVAVFSGPAIGVFFLACANLVIIIVLVVYFPVVPRFLFVLAVCLRPVATTTPLVIVAILVVLVVLVVSRA
jgi:hypothetical protein